MKQSFDSNWASFAYTMTANIGDAVNAETVLLCHEGLGNLGYRVCGSAVDKAFGVKGKTPVYQKRSEVPYSEANVKVFEAAVAAAIAKLENGEDGDLYRKLGIKVVCTGEYVSSEGSAGPGKMATAMAFLAVGDAAVLAKMGLPADADETTVVAKLQSIMAAARKPRTAKVEPTVEPNEESKSEENDESPE